MGALVVLPLVLPRPLVLPLGWCCPLPGGPGALVVLPLVVPLPHGGAASP